MLTSFVGLVRDLLHSIVFFGNSFGEIVVGRSIEEKFECRSWVGAVLVVTMEIPF